MIKKTAEKSKNKKNKQDITGKIAPKKGKKTRTTEKKKEYALKKNPRKSRWKDEKFK